MNSSVIVLGHTLTPVETSGKYDMIIIDTPAGMQGPPPHHHNSYAELFHVLEGELEFMKNGESFTLKAGESVDLPPGTLHTFSNASDKPAKTINIHSPKGFLNYLKSVSVPADIEDAISASLQEELIGKVIASAEENDMIIAQVPA